MDYWERSSLLTVVHLVLFFVHGVDTSSGPELQQSLEQQSPQVHCKEEWSESDVMLKLKLFNMNLHIKRDILHFGSDPSELEKPASFAETQAAKQSLSSKVIVSIYWKRAEQSRHYEMDKKGCGRGKVTTSKASNLLYFQLCHSPQFSSQQRTNLAHRPSWSAFWSLHQILLSPSLHPCKPEKSRHVVSCL